VRAAAVPARGARAAAHRAAGRPVRVVRRDPPVRQAAARARKAAPVALAPVLPLAVPRAAAPVVAVAPVVPRVPVAVRVAVVAVPTSACPPPAAGLAILRWPARRLALAVSPGRTRGQTRGRTQGLAKTRTATASPMGRQAPSKAAAKARAPTLRKAPRKLPALAVRLAKRAEARAKAARPVLRRPKRAGLPGRPAKSVLPAGRKGKPAPAEARVAAARTRAVRSAARPSCAVSMNRWASSMGAFVPNSRSLRLTARPVPGLQAMATAPMPPATAKPVRPVARAAAVAKMVARTAA